MRRGFLWWLWRGIRTWGRTTLFNALCGGRQKVGNYPGVTVQPVEGSFRTPHGVEVRLVDLPGAYSLSPNSPDEAVTRDVLLGRFEGVERPDLVVCVVDAGSLERHLYLARQVIELGLPVVVALNMVDRAEASGTRLDPAVLAEELEVPVVACQANRGKGTVELKQALRFPFPHGVEGREEVPALGSEEEARSFVEGLGGGEAALRAKARRVCEAGSRVAGGAEMGASDKVDGVVLHWLWGWVVLLGMMLAVFVTIFWLADYPMGWIEGGFGALGRWVEGRMPEGELRSLLVDGVIAGVGGTLVFLPQIVLLFFFIAVLEGSGYMARAAFVADGLMARMGMGGRAFLPLVSGYACAIPGVMATRTIGGAKERLVTMLVLPWMSCAARLRVYLLLVPLLVAGAWRQGLVVFGIYLLGTASALGAGFLLRRRMGGGEAQPFLLELPPYRWPDWGFVAREVAGRAWSFVRKAGGIILGVSILLWFLQTYPKAGEGENGLEVSFMGRLGAVLEPAVRPLGWDGRTGTAVLTSFAAREVFVASMAVAHAVEDEEDAERLRERMRAAKWADGRPMFTVPAVLSLLVFFVYALQCLPTTVVVRKESGSWRVALGQLFGMSAFAYVVALVVYQAGRFF